MVMAGQEGSVGGDGWTGRTEVYSFYRKDLVIVLIH